MADDVWHVSSHPVEDGRVVHLDVGGFRLILPALEAHKLGTALRIASGIDTSGHPMFCTPGCPPDCEGPR